MPALGIITSDADDTGPTWNLASRQQKFDMEDTIHQLEPDADPYIRMMTHPDFPTRKARAQKVEWLEDELLPRTANAALGATAGSDTATSIPVAAGFGPYFRVNDLVRNEATGEIFLVTAIVTDTLTVTRGIGAGGVGTLFTATSNLLCIVSNAAVEGAGLSQIRMTRKVAAFNYTQIFRNSYGFTETLMATDLYGPAEPAGEARKKMIEHKRSLEHTCFVGLKDIKNTTANTHPQSFMGGVMSFITAQGGAYVQSVGTLTPAGLEGYMATAFRYGSRRKVMFAAPIVLSALSSFSLAKTALSNFGEGKIYGVSTTRFITGAGDELLVILKRDWGDFPTASPGMGGTAVILDMNEVTYRPLRPTFVKTNVQSNDADLREDEVLTETSLQLVHPRKHMILRNITGF